MRFALDRKVPYACRKRDPADLLAAVPRVEYQPGRRDHSGALHAQPYDKSFKAH